MIEILSRWNRWGTASLPGGVLREVTADIVGYLDTPEVVVLIGPRRAGKTTTLFQVMDVLAERGVPSTATLHVNFEEPAFSGGLDVALLDRIYAAWRARVHPEGRGWVFFDEVQHVSGWERWVRARNESEDIKIFLTGSSSTLMSRELGTLLTGRHLAFEVWPLSLRERLRFGGIEAPPRPALVGAPPSVLQAVDDSRRWGGFPEVVLADADERRRRLLRQYFDDVLFKDVAMRYEVRDVRALRALAVHLLTQTASLVSFPRLANVLGTSVELARAYCGYLEEAYLVDVLDFHTLKTAERVRRPRKVHAVDLGLQNAVTLSASPDHGRVAESLVLGALRREEQDGIGWWKGKQEVDFVVRRANTVVEVVQVTSTDDGSLPPREAASLREAAARFPDARQTLVVATPPGVPVTDDLPGIEVVPLWRFLLTRGAPKEIRLDV